MISLWSQVNDRTRPPPRHWLGFYDWAVSSELGVIWSESILCSPPLDSCFCLRLTVIVKLTFLQILYIFFVRCVIHCNMHHLKLAHSAYDGHTVTHELKEGLFVPRMVVNRLFRETPCPLVFNQNLPLAEICLCWWLGNRVVSVLDSGAEGPGFKSQSRRCRVTVLSKLFTPTVPLFTKQQNCGGNCRPGGN